MTTAQEHIDEAARLIVRAETGGNVRADRLLAFATAHATLAIAINTLPAIVETED